MRTARIRLSSPDRKSRDRCYLHLFAGIILLLAPGVAAANSNETKKILIILAEDVNRPAVSAINQAIRSTLTAALPGQIDISSEYLDNIRHPLAGHEREFLGLFRSKYQGQRFDLVLLVGTNDPLKLLLNNQSSILGDSPVVCITIDQRELAGIELKPNMTGIWPERELKPTLDLALAMHPDTRQVAVVCGTSVFDEFWRKKAEDDFRDYRERLDFNFLVGLKPIELQNALSDLPENTLVFHLAVTRDREDQPQSDAEVLSFVAPASNAPIYGIADTQLGNGIVGGKILSLEGLGIEGARAGLRVLAGERPETITPHAVPSQFLFDWRQLRRWGISERSLPPGSIVRFVVPTAWDQFKWHITALICAVILQTGLIAALVIARSRRRQAEKERERFAAIADAERSQLNEVVSNVPGVVWESGPDSNAGGLKTNFVSHYLTKMLGYSVEEWLSTPNSWQSVVPEAEREAFANQRASILAGGGEGTLQFRCLSKDGRVRWLETHLAVKQDGSGMVERLRGVTLDITDRKLAEESLRQSEEKNRAILRAIPDLMFLQSPEGVYLDYHAKDPRDLLVPPEEFLGRNMHEVLPSELEKSFRTGFDLALETGEPQTVEYSIRLQDAERWFEARVVATADRQLLTVVRDVTARKLAERELRESESRFRTMADALQVALAEVSDLKNQLEEENIYLQEEIKLEHNFHELIGSSDAIKYLFYKIQQVAPTETTVLVQGETGTGKELVARAIHSISGRRDRPLVKVNCAALPASLIESELFGHEKGAFTGATGRRPGRFEVADKATLFLDEVGELPLELQSRLLRVLQEGEFERLGSSTTLKVDVRVIAATNRNLKTEVQKGLFREDLWYRLNVFPITVPPLSQRREDIPLLVEHFVKRFSKQIGKVIQSISPSTMNILQNHLWPGNVRELQNVIERAMISANGPVLRLEGHSQLLQEKQAFGALKTLEEMEAEYLLRVLDQTGWKIEGQNGAARVLGLNPSTLRTRMSKLRIYRPSAQP